MLTAICGPQDIATASSYGISDYVTKPFDFTELMEKVETALASCPA
jgi:DNA-binding response OmpR family regulator